jgi:hypothetical protein
VLCSSAAMAVLLRSSLLALWLPMLVLFGCGASVEGRLTIGSFDLAPLTAKLLTLWGFVGYNGRNGHGLNKYEDARAYWKYRGGYFEADVVFNDRLYSNEQGTFVLFKLNKPQPGHTLVGELQGKWFTERQPFDNFVSRFQGRVQVPPLDDREIYVLADGVLNGNTYQVVVGGSF